MALRQRTWTSRLLRLGAGVILCAAVGCNTTKADRGPNGPNLNPPVKAMGPGNQVSSEVKSPAFANLQGQGPVLNNGMPAMQSNNQQGVMYGGNPNPQTQGVQLPPTNTGNPAYGQQNQQVMPSQYGQPGLAPNGNPQLNQLQQRGQQQPQQQMQLPPLIQYQEPSAPMAPPGLPTSMKDLHLPDSPPTNARDLVQTNDPAVVPASFNVKSPMIDPAPAESKDKPVRILGGITPPSSPGQRATVVTTPVDYQPPLEAPITVVPSK